MFGRDKSERFQSSLPSPGPGHYESNHPGNSGYKANSQAGFQGSERFSADIRDDGSGSFSSPPRRIPSRSGSRAADWTTNRIKDLETELRISKAKIMELQQVVRESNLSEIDREGIDTELREMKNKLLEQKASTAQAQREAIRAETDRKKLESEQANLEMRAKKSEESRRISEAKASEAKYKVMELEKQIVRIEDEFDEREEEYRKEIAALKKRLTTAESSMSKSSEGKDQVNSQLAQLKRLSESQSQQISILETELGASKSAAESLTAENLAEILVIKAELAVTLERDAEKDGLIEALRAEIADLKERLEKTLQEKEELLKELAAIKEENENRAKELIEIKEALKTSEEQVKARDEIVVLLETKLASIQEQNKTKDETLKQAEENVDTLRQDLLHRTQAMENLEIKVENIISRALESVGEAGVDDSSRMNVDENFDERLERASTVIAGHSERLAELGKAKESQENEVQHLTTKVATVLREKKAKVGELERQRKEEKSLRRSLAEQEKNLVDLTKQMEEATTKAKQESDAKGKLQTELKAIRKQLGEKASEVSEWQTKLDALSQEKAMDQEEKERITKEMKEQLEVAQAEVTNNKTILQDLRNQLENAGKTSDEKGGELAQLLAQRTQELSAEKKVHEEKQVLVSDLEKALQEVKDKLVAAAAEKSDAEEIAKQSLTDKATVEENLERSKEVQKTAKATINSQAQELVKLTTAKKKLESDLESAQSGAVEKNGAVADKALALQQTLKEREEEIRDLRAELGEVAKIQEVAKNTNQKTQGKLTKTENEVRQKSSLALELQQEVKNLKQENTDLTREHNQTLTVVKNKLTDREKKIQRYEREISILKERVGQNDGAHQPDVAASVETLQAELDKQKRKYEAQLRSMQGEPKTFKDMRGEVASAHAAAVQSRKQKDAMERQLHEALDRLAFFEGTGHGEGGVENDEVETLKESLREAQRKVSEAQKLATQYRMQLKKSETMKLEMDRLEEENTYLSTRTEQLNADVSGLMKSSGSVLGHHNSKQKIQYHLKLKTDLEELRKEYTILSREKFKLEQAIRYMAARADLMNGNPVADISGTGIRHPSAAVAPASTKDSVVLSTPTAKKHMKWASRGRGTTKSMSAYKPRESMEREIEETQVETVIESEAFKQDTNEESRNAQSHEYSNGNLIDGASHLAPLAHMDAVENRILSTISSVVRGRKRQSSMHYD